MDGTISRTHLLIYESFNYIADKYVGRTYTPDELIAMFGPPEESALERIVGAVRRDAAMAEYLQFYESRHNELASSQDGIEEVLKFLCSRQKHLAIFTGKGTHTTRITLEKLGLAKYFDLVVTGNDVVRHKPSGEGILRIVNALGTQPGKTLMVGDTDSDIKAARDAGVKVATVLWDSYARDRMLHLKSDLSFATVEEFAIYLRATV